MTAFRERLNTLRMVFPGSSGWKIAVVVLMVSGASFAEEGEDTNIVAAVQSDEDASWESVFTAENRVPFHINLYVKDGLFYELMETSEYQGAFFTKVFSEKRRITGRLGMKIHGDIAGFYEEGDLQDIEDVDAAIRRFRLNTFGRGYIFLPLTYGLEFGLAGGDFFFNSGYVWFHEFPYIASLRFGIFTPPMSLEALQSSSSIPLMERAAPVSAFTPGDLFGIQVGGGTLKERATFHTGWFADIGDSENREGSQSYSRLMARLTCLPLDGAKDGQTGGLVHVGLGGSHMFVAGDGVRYQARPESFLAPFLIDTGSLNGDRAYMYNVEAAWQKRAILLQSEFYHTFTDDQFDDLHKFYGAYFSANVALTGEQRKYNRQSGIFSKLIPRRNFSFKDRSWGALEWSSRISYTDLSDDVVRGGEMFVVSSGLNIYLTERNRLMFMAGIADVNDALNDAQDPASGTANGQVYFIQSRLQIDL